MEEDHKADENTKRIIASNLTVAYFAKNPSATKPTAVDRKREMDEIIAVFTDFLIRLGVASM